MKKFKYSLQRVLEVREVTVARCEAMLAGSERALLARQSEERRCDRELRRAGEQILDNVKKKVVPSRECVAHEAWYQHLADRLELAEQATRRETAAVDKRRTELRKAMMDHKVIENLAHRARSDWAQRMRLAEQKSMDEVASGAIERRKYAGKMGASSSHQSAGAQ